MSELEDKERAVKKHLELNHEQKHKKYFPSDRSKLTESKGYQLLSFANKKRDFDLFDLVVQWGTEYDNNKNVNKSKNQNKKVMKKDETSEAAKKAVAKRDANKKEAAKKEAPLKVVGKAEEKKKAAPKKEAAKKKAPGVIATIQSLITKKPQTLQEIAENLAKKFPDKKIESLKGTVNAQLGGKKDLSRMELEKDVVFTKEWKEKVKYISLK